MKERALRSVSNFTHALLLDRVTYGLDNGSEDMKLILHFVMVSAFALCGAAAQAETTQKFVRISCLPDDGQLRVSAIDSDGESPAKIRKMEKNGIFLGQDFNREIGNKIVKTCVLGKVTLIVTVNYGSKYQGGHCGSDPGATISITRDGVNVTAIEPAPNTAPAFDETCRSDLESITALQYDVEYDQFIGTMRLEGKGFPNVLAEGVFGAK
jgi:hypothetical protein